MKNFSLKKEKNKGDKGNGLERGMKGGGIMLFENGPENWDKTIGEVREKRTKKKGVHSILLDGGTARVNRGSVVCSGGVQKQRQAEVRCRPWCGEGRGGN